MQPFRGQQVQQKLPKMLCAVYLLMLSWIQSIKVCLVRWDPACSTEWLGVILAGSETRQPTKVPTSSISAHYIGAEIEEVGTFVGWRVSGGPNWPPPTQTTHRLNQSQGCLIIDTIIFRQQHNQHRPLTVSISTNPPHSLTPSVSFLLSPFHHTTHRLNLTHQSNSPTPHSLIFTLTISPHHSPSQSHSPIKQPHTTQSQSYIPKYAPDGRTAQRTKWVSIHLKRFPIYSNSNIYFSIQSARGYPTKRFSKFKYLNSNSAFLTKFISSPKNTHSSISAFLTPQG